jgi:hypothetical protein
MVRSAAEPRVSNHEATGCARSAGYRPISYGPPFSSARL